MSMIGKTLGHYSVSTLIGRGGMGEVYRAKDQKLGRDVAIKVLPEEFAKDADRVARFQREAKLLASLNHPNIASIYGLEESDGTHFLVLELIEGDTLADRLKRGAIPVEESLKLALQISEALEAAHEKGVIHRDLKPANIKVTPNRKVKVLDFGLAKAFAGEQAEVNLSHSPTLSEAATLQGIILGTAAYMSPEQARGKSVDKRTDIWAFGCVLYEMLTGQAAFQGEDVTEILAAVVKSGVNLDLLPVNIHPRVCEVITRCLQKEQKKRYRDIGEAQYEIEQVLADPSGVFVLPVAAVEPRRKPPTMYLWFASLVLMAIVAGVAVWSLKPTPPPEPRQVTRFEYELPEEQPFIFGGAPLLSISPDGSQFVYCTREGLYLRSMNELDARFISGTKGAITPFFSPDGQWIGYWSSSEEQLKKIPIGGGAPVTLCDTMNPLHPTWNIDDTIVYIGAEGIMRISGNGGTPEVIVDREEDQFFAPQILPDGKWVLFTTHDGNEYSLAVQSLESGERKELVLGANATYLPTGHLLYFYEYDLYAVPFDLETLELASSGPVLMAEEIWWRGGTSAPQYAISDSGTLIYVPGITLPEAVAPKYSLIWVDRQGKVEEIDADPDYYNSPQISPDGTKLALRIGDPREPSDIHIRDFNSGNIDRLTFNENSTDFLWTPDSQRIVFIAGEGDEAGIYCKNSDGTGEEDLLALVSDGGGPPWSWADDGKTLVTTKRSSGQGFGMGGAPLGMIGLMMSGRRGRAPKQSPVPKRAPSSEESSSSEEMDLSVEIGTLSMEGEHEWKQLFPIEGFLNALQISPDHRWMAYNSYESEQLGVYVRPFPDVDSGGLWQVSTGNAINCLWSPIGRELFYVNIEDGSFVAVEVETEPTFKKVKTNPLFKFSDIGLPSSTMLLGYDISLDGNRFLATKPVETSEDESRAEEPTAERSNKIIVVTNWFEELKQRVPVE